MRGKKEKQHKWKKEGIGMRRRRAATGRLGPPGAPAGACWGCNDDARRVSSTFRPCPRGPGPPSSTGHFSRGASNHRDKTRVYNVYVVEPCAEFLSRIKKDASYAAAQASSKARSVECILQTHSSSRIPKVNPFRPDVQWLSK